MILCRKLTALGDLMTCQFIFGLHLSFKLYVLFKRDSIVESAKNYTSLDLHAIDAEIFDDLTMQ